jgi:hypothetical protein
MAENFPHESANSLTWVIAAKGVFRNPTAKRTRATTVMPYEMAIAANMSQG